MNVKGSVDEGKKFVVCKHKQTDEALFLHWQGEKENGHHPALGLALILWILGSLEHWNGTQHSPQ